MKRDLCRLRYDSADPAGEVRDDLRARLARWRAEDLTDDAAVVVSELLSNALRHGRPPVRVVCALRRRSGDRATLHVEVADAGHGFDAARIRARWRRPSFALGESGRGLYLVDALACRWGDRPTRTGHVVWADLRVDGGEAPWSGGRCAVRAAVRSVVRSRARSRAESPTRSRVRSPTESRARSAVRSHARSAARSHAGSAAPPRAGSAAPPHARSTARSAVPAPDACAIRAGGGPDRTHFTA
ncbi:ATP-binding protein [Streptomyces sp. NPDC046985]|uniref:ATP-binding protein n=1 Tax=Streptomyces sp. NPDC046985 TaxID=3155377 RepID=UPI0033E5E5BE